MSERPERESVRVEGSPVRCPFCHEGVRVEDGDWVACASCLARHHGECWGEGGRCGACGGGERLTPASDGGVAAATGTGSAAPTPITGPTFVPDPPSPLVDAILGAPRRLVFACTIPGEVGPDAADLDEAVVGIARRRIGEPGHFERVGRTLAWGTLGPRHGHRAVTVTVAPRDGQTVVEVQEDLGQLIGGLFGGIGGGLGGGGQGIAWGVVFTMTRSIGLTVATAIGIVVLSIALVRAIYMGVARSRRAALETFAEAIAREVAARVRPVRRDPKKEAEAS